MFRVLNVILLVFNSKFLVINGIKFEEITRVTFALLKNLNPAVTLDISTCWSDVQKLQFIKLSNRLSMYVRFIDLTYKNDSDHHNNALIVDFNCNSIKVSMNRHIIIAINELKNGFDVPSSFLHPSKNFYYFKADDENNGKIKIMKAYQLSKSKNKIFETFAIHEKFNKTFTKFNPKTSIISQRKNFNGFKLKASMVITNNHSLTHFDDKSHKHIDTITKVNFHLTNRLIEWLNASINYSVVDSWGYFDNKTNKWNGMIGELIDNKADIGASPLFLTSDRIDVIDYLICTSQTRSKFVFRSPKLSFTENVFLLPFDKFVWICLLMLPFIAAIVLYFSMFIEWKMEEKRNDEHKPTLMSTFLLLYCALTQQGSAMIPKAFSSRLIVVISFTAFLFLYSSYSANIVALLQSPSNKIKSLSDLLISKMDFGVDDTIFNHFYFSHADEPIRREIYQTKIKDKNGKEKFFDLTKGIEKMRQGLFAFHMEVGVGYKIVSETFQEDEKCGLQEIQYLQVVDPYYAIQKDSKYKEFIKVGLMRLKEIGIQVRNGRFMDN
ncbi:hypothetical protein PVAND_015149 [Polypedilum vanderplanki]|uniref:Uncharacterized protein n=1 Tax=Polypedilum vanderplanki TaxID=319348 RepID=A0A9J6BC67_POLVA|nr:hypothetical protein PVAND_015149 [Polypedilum vanderplanki]